VRAESESPFAIGSDLALRIQTIVSIVSKRLRRVRPGKVNKLRRRDAAATHRRWKFRGGSGNLIVHFCILLVHFLSRSTTGATVAKLAASIAEQSRALNRRSRKFAHVFLSSSTFLQGFQFCRKWRMTYSRYKLLKWKNASAASAALRKATLVSPPTRQSITAHTRENNWKLDSSKNVRVRIRTDRRIDRWSIEKPNAGRFPASPRVENVHSNAQVRRSMLRSKENNRKARGCERGCREASRASWRKDYDIDIISCGTFVGLITALI